MQKGWHYIGFVTQQSVKAGCPLPIGAAVSNHKALASKEEAKRIAKRQRLSNVQFLSAPAMLRYREQQAADAAAEAKRQATFRCRVKNFFGSISTALRRLKTLPDKKTGAK